MCTLSFFPFQDGFHLLMNRDEQRSRPAALPPILHSCGKFRAVYAFERTGGTWIGCNETGLCFALINWYSRPQLDFHPAFSRGMIIPELLATESLQLAETHLRHLPLSRLNPFRLIAASAKEKVLHEFRSDAVSLEKVSFPWEKRHWFSSGHDEPQAMRERTETCSKTIYQPGDPLTLLRNIHRSHAPKKGPFSICMHREDACTVSFTEITIKNRHSAISYYNGPPCEVATLPTSLSLALTF